MKFLLEMIKFKTLLVVASLFILTPITLVAQSDKDLLKRPSPPRLVNDVANVIDATAEAQLENKLVQYNDTTSTQIAVITIPSVEPYEIGDYAYKIGRYWGVGNANFDNGIVLLVAVDDHRMFIATGYGTEAYLTDIRCNQIIDQILTPAFQQNDFYGGIDNATTEMMKYMTGAYEGQPYGNANDAPPTLIIIIIIIIIIFFISRRTKGGGGTTFSRRGPTYWGGGGFGGFGGGGFGGGGGGGGFGGFGGGGFGGGGAGGSW